MESCIGFPRGLRVDSNFLCFDQKVKESCFCNISWIKGCKLLPILFFFLVGGGLSFLFNFNKPKKEGRVLGILIIGYMSSHDKGLLDGLFMFKESEKDLIYSISKSLDLCRSMTRDCSRVFLCLWSRKKT